MADIMTAYDVFEALEKEREENPTVEFGDNWGQQDRYSYRDTSGVKDGKFV